MKCGLIKMPLKNFIYRNIGFIPVESLKDKLNSLNKFYWNKNDSRKIFDSQKEVDTIFVEHENDIFNPVFFSKFRDDYIIEFLNPEYNFILEKIKQFLGYGIQKRVFLAKLEPKRNIAPHGDYGYHLENCRRIHIPIKSNPNVFFFINHEKYSFQEGLIFEINNQLVHSVENNSDEERIHLIIDWGKNND